jgi:hypothetical protein
MDAVRLILSDQTSTYARLVTNQDQHKARRGHLGEGINGARQQSYFGRIS